MSLGGTLRELEKLQLSAIIIQMIFASIDRRPLTRYFRSTRSLRNCLLTYNNIPLNARDNHGMRWSRPWRRTESHLEYRLSLIVENMRAQLPEAKQAEVSRFIVSKISVFSFSVRATSSIHLDIPTAEAEKNENIFFSLGRKTNEINIK